MKVHKNDLHKVKEPETFKYIVFTIDARRLYRGESEIAATDIVKARRRVKEFCKEDKGNKEDSGGYGDIWGTEYLADTPYFHKRIYYSG